MGWALVQQKRRLGGERRGGKENYLDGALRFSLTVVSGSLLCWAFC